MQVYNGINDNNKDLSVALGFFDGIHLGHSAVLNSAVSYAKSNNLKSAVLTFENHPKCYFTGCEPQYIISKQEKLTLFESFGIDYVYFLKFDEGLSKLKADEYLEFLNKNLKPKAIFTGFNHTFGSNREGNSEFLDKNQTKYGYEYFKIPPVKVDGSVVSSSVIRENLKSGNIESVNKMLSRKYSLKGIVIEGEKIGRIIGFRTANLLYPKHLLNISRGVYSVEVQHKGREFRAIANFGMRPSLANTNIPILEVHILNFDEDIYGDELTVRFIKKIRDEKKFNSLDELKAQIKKDIGEVEIL